MTLFIKVQWDCKCYETVKTSRTPMQSLFWSSYRQVGFLSRDVASQMAPLIDQQLVEQIECEVMEVTGLGEDEHFGLNIRLTYWENS